MYVCVQCAEADNQKDEINRNEQHDHGIMSFSSLSGLSGRQDGQRQSGHFELQLAY